MKKIIASCLVLTLSTTTIFSASAIEYGVENNPNDKVYEQTFGDVPTNHWAFDYVADLVDRNVIDGYPDGNFYPDNTINREAFAKILTLASGTIAEQATVSYFVDVPTYLWSASYINASKDYVTAYSINNQLYYKPTESAVREDMAVAIVKMKGYDTSLADLDIIQTMFSDYNQISDSAKPYIAVAVEKGVISGFTDGTFRPQATITRAESSAMLWRAFQYGDDNKVVVDDVVTDVIDPNNPQVEGQTDVVVPEIPQSSYVETLNSSITSDENYTYDENGNYYYVSRGDLVQVTNGVSKTLVKSDDLTFQMNAYEIGEDTNKIYYFDYVSIEDVAYNAADNKTYIVTTNRTGVDNGSMRVIIVYDINNLNYKNGILINNTKYSNGTQFNLVGTNDKLLLDLYGGYASLDDSNGIYEINTKTKTYEKIKTTTFLLDAGSNSKKEGYMSYINNNIYVNNGALLNAQISKYNFNTGKLEAITMIPNDIDYIYGFNVHNNEIYISAKDGIYKLFLSGERYDAKLIVSYDDIEVLDRMSLSCIRDFIFDDDGNIIFKDYDNLRIRKLTIVD